MQKERVTFRYFLLNKPYGYLSQFTGEKNDLLLGQLYNFPKDVYSVGRLDKDSEGLLLLTNDNNFKTRLLDPKSKHTKTYWVQVEGEISETALRLLENGSIEISHNNTKHLVEKANCRIIHPENIEERNPPIRFRANIPTSWIELTLTEGKNRQVRKMTASAGFPTLRLIRKTIGKIELEHILPGNVLEITVDQAEKAFI
jgi:23S rRNA pseudouridine2457 synthase